MKIRFNEKPSVSEVDTYPSKKENAGKNKLAVRAVTTKRKRRVGVIQASLIMAHILLVFKHGEINQHC